MSADLSGKEKVSDLQQTELTIKLVSSVMHDFNNQLTTIMINCDQLLKDQSGSSKYRKNIETISDTVDLAAQLMARLEIFKPVDGFELNKVKLAYSLYCVEDLLHHILGEAVEIVINPVSEELTANTFPGLVEQLLIEAALKDRIPLIAGGSFTVSIESQNSPAGTSLAEGKSYIVIQLEVKRPEQREEELTAPPFEFSNNTVSKVSESKGEVIFSITSAASYTINIYLPEFRE